MTVPTYAPVWLDPADVSAWLRANGLPADPELDRVCGMSEAYVQRCRPDQWTTGDPDAVPPVEPAYVPDAEVYQGAVMYAARQTRRRNSPSGSELFGDGSVGWPTKYDADIERALRTGSANLPGVG